MGEQRIISVDITHLVTAALAQHSESAEDDSQLVATSDE